MHYLNIALFWVFFGFLCSYLAKRKERNPTLWFWLGIFLGVIGVITLLILPKVRKQMAPAYAAPVPQPEPEEVNPTWFYLSSAKEQKGPFFLKDLKVVFSEEKLGVTTYFWCEGMESWQKLSDLPELNKKITSSP